MRADDVSSLQAYMTEHRADYARQRDTFQRMVTGDASLVDAADRLLRLTEEVPLPDGVARQTVRAVAGGCPDVPAMLAGSPVNMRMRRPAPAQAPLCIVVTPSCLAEYTDAERMRRGASTVALLRRIEETGRRVELYMAQGNDVCMNGSAAFMSVKLDTQPVCLAQLCWFLCTFDGLVQTALATVYALGGGTGSAAPFCEDRQWRDHPRPYQLAFAAVLGVDPADVIALPAGGTKGRKHYETDAAAAAWVNETFNRAIAPTDGE